MKKLTTKLMIAATALVVTAGAASAQTMRARFRSSSAWGIRSWRREPIGLRLATRPGAPIFQLLNVHSRRSAIAVAAGSSRSAEGMGRGESEAGVRVRQRTLRAR